MIFIDYKDSRPIYEQVVSKLEELILKGVLEPDSQMPSVRSLAMDLSINPNTIQKAYAQMERDGYIYAVKGRGNFVSKNDVLLEQKKEELKNKMKELISEAEELGITREELMNMCES